MDPIYQQVNQNRLTENTQRSSDNLRMQQSKETKRKSERAGEVSSGDSTELTLGGDDMLGDMDPDMFGGGAGRYQRMFEDDEEPKPDSADQDSDADQEAEEPEDGLALEDEDFEDEQDPHQESQAKTEDGALGRPLERPDTLPASKPESGKKEPQSQSKPAPTATASKAQDVSKPSAKVATVSTAKEKAPEKVVIGREAVAPSLESNLTSAIESRSKLNESYGVFFDASQGFLIAEEFQPEPNEEPATETVYEAPVSQDIQVLLAQMVIGDQSSTAYRKLQGLLSRFGLGVLTLCHRHGTRVYLLPNGISLTQHPLLDSHASQGHDMVDAAYLFAHKAVLIESSCIESVPELFHPVLMYFAYAFDHALGGEEYASTRAPAVRYNFEACAQGGTIKSPLRFSDTMASVAGIHFFAQAVESYLSENDCEHPMWSRQDLYDFDRPMYDYVDYLFRRQNKSGPSA